MLVGIDWGAKASRGRPKRLWVDRCKTNLEKLGISESAVSDATNSKEVFKKLVVAAVAQMDEANMKLEAAGRSSIAAFLELDNISTGRRMGAYLDSDNRRGAELMFQCRAGCLRLNALVGKWNRTAPRLVDDGTVVVGGSLECGCCSNQSVESLQHFVLECSCYDSAGLFGRQEFLSKLKLLAGDPLFAVWEGLSVSERVGSLLGDKFWEKASNGPVSAEGEKLPVSCAVHGLLQKFLVSAWKVREDFLASVTSSARGDTERVANGHVATARN
jgi:hypothetical protein